LGGVESSTGEEGTHGWDNWRVVDIWIEMGFLRCGVKVGAIANAVILDFRSSVSVGTTTTHHITSTIKCRCEGR
jgi:hypothetical protein